MFRILKKDQTIPQETVINNEINKCEKMQR